MPRQKHLTRSELHQLRLLQKTLNTLLILAVVMGISYGISYGISDSRLFSFICLLAMTAYLHGVGKSRRPGHNLMTGAATIFSSSERAFTIEAHNEFRNIINGGDWLFQQIKKMSTGLLDDDGRLENQQRVFHR